MSDILKHLLELWKQETNPETKKQLLHLVNEQMQNEQNAEKPTNNEYPVYPEDDGTDRFRNPYSPV